MQITIYKYNIYNCNYSVKNENFGKNVRSKYCLSF